MSIFAVILAELLGVGVEAAARSVGGEDRRHLRGLPRDREDAIDLVASLPPLVGTLGRVERDELETWYRGGAGHASVLLMDVTRVGFDDVRSFLTAALERGEVIDDCDLDGEIVYVASTEPGTGEGAVGAWGLASTPWAIVVSADSATTRADVTAAVVERLRSGL
jgi:hypothetical protein